MYTRRRKLKLCKDGYMYVFDKKSKKEENVSFWRCHLRDTCNARAHAVNENITLITKEHSHGPAPAEVEVERIKTDIIKTAGLYFFKIF